MPHHRAADRVTRDALQQGSVLFLGNPLDGVAERRLFLLPQQVKAIRHRLNLSSFDHGLCALDLACEAPEQILILLNVLQLRDAGLDLFEACFLRNRFDQLVHGSADRSQHCRIIRFELSGHLRGQITCATHGLHVFLRALEKCLLLQAHVHWVLYQPSFASQYSGEPRGELGARIPSSKSSHGLPRIRIGDRGDLTDLSSQVPDELHF
mmetsp:Transcript_21071/g.23458  ORF Transcript_21071/g.23458 Transcript_21071/m.23458 type:complete len:209 (-) Transcript_21071:111-737(-)